jgi:gamma-carbonic anhydrase
LTRRRSQVAAIFAQNFHDANARPSFVESRLLQIVISIGLVSPLYRIVQPIKQCHFALSKSSIHRTLNPFRTPLVRHSTQHQMSSPSMVQRARQLVGRAIRETGQALDRSGVRVASWASTKYDFEDDPVLFQDHLSRHRQQIPLLESGKPIIHPDVAFVAPCSTLVGSVRVGPGASIWYGAVLRADECMNAKNEMASAEEVKETNNSNEDDHDEPGAIFIGRDTNVQDSCIITAREGHTVLGQGVTVGHLAQIHSATVHDFSLIGMGSILQPGVVVERESFVAAGAVVPRGQVVHTGELWVGNPARKLRDLTPEQRKKLHYQSDEYVKVGLSQKQVMELGGNLSDEQIAELQLLASEVETEALPEGDVETSHAVPTRAQQQQQQ